VGGQTWTFPSRAECLQCHSQAAGRTLGLEAGQLNRDFNYSRTGRAANQLSTLEKIGVFDAPLPGPVSALARYPDPQGPGALDPRARAYLHTNCSSCHRPQGTGGGPADLRFSTRLPQANVCNVVPQHGNLGVASPMIVLPGNPARSVLSLRMKALTSNRMPPLATRSLDASGTAVIDAWIAGLAGCQ
jgi:mono/diheme cytochrome c family protein